VSCARAARLALAFLPGSAPAQHRPPVQPRAGLVITASARFVPGRYRIPASDSPDSAVLIVRGDNITLDLAGVVLEGQDPAADPDRAAGVGIRIEGGRNVRLLNAGIHGYKVGILARGTRGLRLIGNDVGRNWKPRLFSVVEHESLVDWLSFHHNEAEEWLRFGAGIYLTGVHGGEIRDNRGEQGMNGLLLAGSDSLRIVDNTFSFNSGLGIGLYRSSGNSILHNRIEFNVRGYSHGFYRRGQDSAGLLLYEQSSRNIVAWNAVSHGGDGLFLWAGQSTMDSGEGGASDNLFFGNDFSFAPTNAMEATFSRNTFVANRATGSDYGLWGGYSHESRIVANCFAGNRNGVAIEHGQDNLVEANRFAGDETAVWLWANPVEASDWGYPKHRDTRSRDYRIEGNSFTGHRVALRVANTAGLAVTGNRFAGIDSLEVMRDTAGVRRERNTAVPAAQAPSHPADTCGEMPAVPAAWLRLAPREPAAFRSVPSSPLAGRNRSAIIVDEWGPYDWRAPKLWPLDSTRRVPLRLRVLGPPGRWRVVESRGVGALSIRAGRMGDTLAVTPASGSVGDWSVTLEYRGLETVSPRGERTPAGEPVRFGWSRFEPPQAWAVRFEAWSDSTDPRSHPEAFTRLLAAPPLLARTEPRLDYEWFRPTVPGLPQARFALEAGTAISLPPGEFTLRTISDDGIRVWVDGALVIDHWSMHESAVDYAALTPGRHELRVQYFQVDGWAELRLDILRGTERSPGSAGPK
jgi:parallel beta-helix repeat protein